MKQLFLNLLVLLAIALLASCTMVQPNFRGVLMENYGKSGKSDYSLVTGKVNTMAWGTELFQVPTWIQRASFADNGAVDALKLKASDNTEFTARPSYSYQVVSGREIDLVFANSRLGSGEEFMRQLENNVLEPRIYDIVKEESRKYQTDSLMATGGSLRFEKDVEETVRKAFEVVGLKLETFTCQLEFSAKVKEKIDNRNEVNTNISVLDQKILEQRKTNELEQLKTEQQLIRSRGLTPEILQMEALDAWRVTKQPIYGNYPIQFTKPLK